MLKLIRWCTKNKHKIKVMWHHCNARSAVKYVILKTRGRDGIKAEWDKNDGALASYCYCSKLTQMWWLNKANLLSYSARHQKIKISLTVLIFRYHQGLFLLETLGKNPSPCFFQLLEGTHIPWPVALFSIFKVISSVSSDLSLIHWLPFPLSHFLLWPWCLSLISSLVTPLNPHGCSLHLSVLNLI